MSAVLLPLTTEGVDWNAFDAHVGRTVDAGLVPAVELAPVFHPDGRIWTLDEFRAVLDLPQCVGVKHSSLRRQPGWDRLAVPFDLRVVVHDGVWSRDRCESYA